MSTVIIDGGCGCCGENKVLCPNECPILISDNTKLQVCITLNSMVMVEDVIGTIVWPSSGPHPASAYNANKYCVGYSGPGSLSNPAPPFFPDGAFADWSILFCDNPCCFALSFGSAANACSLIGYNDACKDSKYQFPIDGIWNLSVSKQNCEIDQFSVTLEGSVTGNTNECKASIYLSITLSLCPI